MFTIINIPPVRWIFILVDKEDVDYSNITATFTFSEMNGEGRDYRMCYNRWKDFKQTKHADTVLYRITPKNYWHIWNYGDYLFAEKYKYQFKKIEISRSPNFLNSGYQDF